MRSMVLPRLATTLSVASVTGWALTGAGTSLAGTTTAPPRQPIAGLVQNGGSAGVANARAHGIAVDAQSAATMAQAPVGSCLSAPTQSRCPRVTAVVASGNDPDSAGGAYGPSSLTGGSLSAAAVNGPSSGACVDRAVPPVKGKRYGKYFHPSATGYNYCPRSTQVDWMEVYATLQRYLGGWQNLANNSDTGGIGGGVTLTAHAVYTKCVNYAIYPYRTNELAYAIVNGVGYTDIHTAYASFSCH